MKMTLREMTIAVEGNESVAAFNNNDAPGADWAMVRVFFPYKASDGMEAGAARTEALEKIRELLRLCLESV